MPESERVVAMKRAAPLRKTESTPTLRLFRERRGLFCLDLYRGRPSGARPYRPYCLFRYRHTPGRGESKWPLLKRRPYQCDCEFWDTCSLRRNILSAPSAFGDMDVLVFMVCVVLLGRSAFRIWHTMTSPSDPRAMREHAVVMRYMAVPQLPWCAESGVAIATRKGQSS